MIRVLRPVYRVGFPLEVRGVEDYFAVHMKRLLLAIALLSSMPLLAQDTAATAAAAEREQEIANRFTSIHNDMERLADANRVLRQEVDRLRGELSRVQDAQSRLTSKIADNANNSAEAIKTLKEKITEVDSHRESDKQAISDELKRSVANLESSVSGILKAVTNNRPARVERPAPTKPEAPVVSDTAFPYTVQKGDSPGKILARYNSNSDFKKEGQLEVTLSQLKAANPKINWSKPIVPGMKLNIPAPLDAPPKAK